MSLKHLNRLAFTQTLFQNYSQQIVTRLPPPIIRCYASTKTNKQLIISCNRKKYNFHKGDSLDKLGEVRLASKGWTHSKANGDHFTIIADPSERDHPKVPWMDLGVRENVVEVLRENGLEMATEFQARAVGEVLKGGHTLIAAETGCGKTYAYLLPLLQKLAGAPSTEQMNTPRLLVLVPNRELAPQIGNIATEIGKVLNLNVQAVVGGKTKKLMLNPEFSNIDVLVGTPGAIGKLSTVGIYKLHEVRMTVLDEADTLMDDSFVERMQSLLKRVTQAQMVFVSATLPKKLPNFLEPILESLNIVQSERLHRPLMNATQKFMRLTKSAKPSYLLEIATKTKRPMIIFTNKNQTCNWLSQFLRENGIPCSNINGDMNSMIRNEQWRHFTKGDVNILAATDVGSRGLDTTQVSHILNYDFPLHPADYIHRVGRIGRLGSLADSKVTNFVSGHLEVELVQNIEMAIRTNGEIKYVDGNITHIVQKNITKRMREAGL